MDRSSNPGSATPRRSSASTRTAPRSPPTRSCSGRCRPRRVNLESTLGCGHSHLAKAPRDRAAEQAAERESLLQQRAIMAPMPQTRPAHQQHHSHAGASVLGERRRADSPPRGHFKVITHCGATAAAAATAARRPQAGGGGGRGSERAAAAAAAAAAIRPFRPAAAAAAASSSSSSATFAPFLRRSAGCRSSSTARRRGAGRGRRRAQLTLNSLDMSRR